jgi:hypothetical protein
MRNMNTRTKALFGTIIAIVMSAELSLADGVLTYGDKDVLGTGNYSQDPTTGATLLGLQAGQVTFGAPPTFHSYPFDPDPTDYPSTDQIFTGSNQTGFHDGYSVYENRAPGPQVITLDYSSLIPAGSQIDTFTLGIGADDFQFPVWRQPFSASINGTVNAALKSTLNSLVQTGPVVQFFSIGLDPASLDESNVLTLTIDNVGDGGDGWAVDFLTVGVQTTSLLIEVDIKPGTFPNSINPRGKGVIPVAILTTDTFDATTVDPTTVRFGPTGTEAAPVQSALEDVDGDGDTDMILHFKTQDTGIVCGDTSASLTGETFGGQAIEGTDFIKTVGCK